jgi:hypothetical protein
VRRFTSGRRATASSYEKIFSAIEPATVRASLPPRRSIAGFSPAPGDLENSGPRA